MPVSSQEEKSTRGAVVVSDEQILTAFVDSGLSSHEVAHSLGVRVQRVQQVCTREFGADAFQAQESLAVKRLTERMRQLLQEGKTQAAVMRECKVSQTSLNQLVIGQSAVSLVVNDDDPRAKPINGNGPHQIGASATPISIKMHDIEIKYATTMAAEDSIAYICQMLKEFC